MNRKILLLFLVLIMFISGCTMVSFSKAQTQKGDTSNIEDVEEDVNGIDIQEDEDLTENAEENNITEEDILIPQEESKEEIELEKEEDVVIETFKTELPGNIYPSIQYDKYPTSHNYLLILSKHINIREKPNTTSKIVNNASLFEKMNLMASVKGQNLEKYNSDLWYKVFWKEANEIKYGYIFSTLGEPRQFQFTKMEEALTTLKNEVENNQTAYVANYKNRNGKSPLYKGKTMDPYGERRYQSAPAYVEPDLQSEFRYIPDGTLVSLLEETDDFYKIRSMNFQEVYWIPKKYLSFKTSIEELTKVVIIDRKKQNEGVFEYIDDQWHLISYVFATTGQNAKYKLETPLGYYMAIETKSKFLYLDDKTKEIAGYAPYATRFTGGAYIHGVPVDFHMVDDKRIDPGMKEYLFTIGTVPRSHRCVRNYTSHAKFLYEWIEVGKSAVIVIE